jgi:hypothetical protein
MASIPEKTVVASVGTHSVTDHLRPVIDWLKDKGYTPSTRDAFGLTSKSLGVYGFAQPLDPEELRIHFEFPPSILITPYGVHDVANHLSIQQYLCQELLIDLEAENQELNRLIANKRKLDSLTELCQNREWQRSLQGSIREKARVYNSFLTYMEDNRIWREYPASGELYEVLSGDNTMVLRSVHGLAMSDTEPQAFSSK